MARGCSIILTYSLCPKISEISYSEKSMTKYIKNIDIYGIKSISLD
jgi:hypothetical protein